MKEIPLTHGKATIVDDDMHEHLSQFKWCAVFMNGKDWYAMRPEKINGVWRMLRMHRIIANTPPGMVTDHINRNSLDNRRENLRVCTRAENARNTDISKKNKSGYKGVSWDEHAQKYVAHIRVNRKAIHLGCFGEAEEAARVYDEAAKGYFGKFASTNF